MAAVVIPNHRSVALVGRIRSNAGMNRSLMAVFLLAAAAPSPAQDGGARLALKPDADNIAAAVLPGRWVSTPGLSDRLQTTVRTVTMEFRTDSKALARVPAASVARFEGRRIYQAGRVIAIEGDKENRGVYLLTTLAGQAAVALYFERDGKLVPRFETWKVMAVPGHDRKVDLLFFVEESPARAAVVALERTSGALQFAAVAAMTEMIALLEAGKNHEMIERFAHPDDLAKMTEDGGSVADIAAGFTGSKSKLVLEMLRRCVKVAPELGEGGDLATWDEEGARPLRMRRVAGRWYLLN